LGNKYTGGFGIKIAKMARVDELKELIKAKNSPALNKITTNLFDIWKVSVVVQTSVH
jgi:hypothetical protein